MVRLDRSLIREIERPVAHTPTHAISGTKRSSLKLVPQTISGASLLHTSSLEPVHGRRCSQLSSSSVVAAGVQVVESMRTLVLAPDPTDEEDVRWQEDQVKLTADLVLAHQEDAGPSSELHLKEPDFQADTSLLPRARVAVNSYISDVMSLISERPPSTGGLCIQMGTHIVAAESRVENASRVARSESNETEHSSGSVESAAVEMTAAAVVSALFDAAMGSTDLSATPDVAPQMEGATRAAEVSACATSSEERSSSTRVGCSLTVRGSPPTSDLNASSRVSFALPRHEMLPAANQSLHLRTGGDDIGINSPTANSDVCSEEQWAESVRRVEGQVAAHLREKQSVVTAFHHATREDFVKLPDVPDLHTNEPGQRCRPSKPQSRSSATAGPPGGSCTARGMRKSDDAETETEVAPKASSAAGAKGRGCSRQREGETVRKVSNAERGMSRGGNRKERTSPFPSTPMGGSSAAVQAHASTSREVIAAMRAAVDLANSLLAESGADACADFYRLAADLHCMHRAAYARAGEESELQEQLDAELEEAMILRRRLEKAEGAFKLGATPSPRAQRHLDATHPAGTEALRPKPNTAEMAPHVALTPSSKEPVLLPPMPPSSWPSSLPSSVPPKQPIVEARAATTHPEPQAWPSPREPQSVTMQETSVEVRLPEGPVLPSSLPLNAAMPYTLSTPARKPVPRTQHHPTGRSSKRGEKRVFRPRGAPEEKPRAEGTLMSEVDPARSLSYRRIQSEMHSLMEGARDILNSHHRARPPPVAEVRMQAARVLEEKASQKKPSKTPSADAAPEAAGESAADIEERRTVDGISPASAPEDVACRHAALGPNNEDAQEGERMQHAPPSAPQPPAPPPPPPLPMQPQRAAEHHNVRSNMPRSAIPTVTSEPSPAGVPEPTNEGAAVHTGKAIKLQVQDASGSKLDVGEQGGYDGAPVHTRETMRSHAQHASDSRQDIGGPGDHICAAGASAAKDGHERAPLSHENCFPSSSVEHSPPSKDKDKHCPPSNDEPFGPAMNFAKDARGPTSLTVDSVVAQQRATAIEMQREWLRMEKVREEEAELQAMLLLEAQKREEEEQRALMEELQRERRELETLRAQQVREERRRHADAIRRQRAEEARQIAEARRQLVEQQAVLKIQVAARSMLQERTRLRRQLAEEIAADERAVRVAHADMLAKRRAEERLLEQARRMKPLASQAGGAPPHTEGEQTYVLPHPSETLFGSGDDSLSELVCRLILEEMNPEVLPRKPTTGDKANSGRDEDALNRQGLLANIPLEPELTPKSGQQCQPTESSSAGRLALNTNPPRASSTASGAARIPSATVDTQVSGARLGGQEGADASTVVAPGSAAATPHLQAASSPGLSGLGEFQQLMQVQLQLMEQQSRQELSRHALTEQQQRQQQEEHRLLLQLLAQSQQQLHSEAEARRTAAVELETAARRYAESSAAHERQVASAAEVAAKEAADAAHNAVQTAAHVHEEVRTVVQSATVLAAETDRVRQIAVETTEVGTRAAEEAKELVVTFTSKVEAHEEKWANERAANSERIEGTLVEITQRLEDLQKEGEERKAALSSAKDFGKEIARAVAKEIGYPTTERRLPRRKKASRPALETEERVSSAPSVFSDGEVRLSESEGELCFFDSNSIRRLPFGSAPLVAKDEPEIKLPLVLEDMSDTLSEGELPL